VGAEGIVAWGRGLEGGRNHRLAGLVQHGHDAEVVALVIDEVKEFSQGLVRGQPARHAREVEDAGFHRHGGAQVS
jgi:hypothetical protein